MKCFCTYFILFVGFACFGQNEKSIDEQKVPLPIKEYLKKEYPSSKVKYYTEKDKDSTLYLVSVKDKGDVLHFEFYANGQLYEIEKEVEFEDLPPTTQSNITQYLKERFAKYNILQTQFVNPHLKIEYELFIKGKDKNGARFWEIYFDEKGTLIRSEEVIPNPINTMF